MRVKILSMQRVVNYGSFMQAYALKKVIESFGHTVHFCDFRAGMPRHHGCKVKKVNVLDRLMRLPYVIFHLRRYLEERRFRKEMHHCFATRAWRKLGLTEARDYDYSGDLMVIGSDEVFNYTQNHAFGYVPALFGHGVDTTSLISYAASAGYASVQDVEQDGMGDEISAGLARFDAISVRDRNTFALVSRYAPRPPAQVIDPTLLYDFDKEIPEPPTTPGYLLVYAYDGRLDAPEDIYHVRQMASQRGLRTVSVGFYHTWCDENLVVSPFELLAVFKHADCVVTDTFHGSIFSIKFHKQFVSLIRSENRWGSNANKLGFLLEQLKLDHRICRDLAMLAAHMDIPVDYVPTALVLSDLRDDSMRFLEDALKMAESKVRA